MSSVTIKNVGKYYGKLEVIHSLNATIEDNSFVVLLGPSGCGKSTLLRMIAGLEDLTSGDIMIGGNVVNNLPPKARDIAMVFQNYALYPHMNIYDNMAFSLKLSKTPKDTIREKVMNAANILGMEQYLDRYPKQLSGGQRQRVAMGRAIVRDPKVFLFDEPLSNLDAKLRVQMRTEIKSLHQRLNATCIYVTHDQIEAMTMADKIVVMRNGNIEQYGSPLEIYDKPSNLFVAGFIGSPPMNLIEGTARRDGDTVKLQLDDQSSIPLPGTAPVTDGQKIVFGVRPGDLRISQDSGLPVVVEVVEQTGSETLLFGNSNGNPLCFATSERQSIKPGDEIVLNPEQDRIHLFDARTEERLDKTMQ